MAKKKIEVKSGDRYWMLTVLEEVEPYIRPSGSKERRFKCRCDCGNVKIVLLSSLRSGRTSSCGCYARQMASKANSKTNEYDLSGEIGIGYTSKGEQFLFDKESYELIKDYCWYINNNGYVAARDRSAGKYILLHRLVMHPMENEDVDHINHDTRNNCKNNLRACSHGDNMKNKSIKKDNVSGVTGVFWKKLRSKWEATIIVSGKKKHLGYFTNFNDAAKSRIKAELELFGKYSANYNYFTEKQREAILNDEMPSEEIVKLLNQKSVDKQYSTCYNKDK